MTIWTNLIEMPGRPHEGDCEGTLCPDCGCCWHKKVCDQGYCYDTGCGCYGSRP